MKICTLSPLAYVLRKQWEREDKKVFAKFRKDEEILQVINALAEMIVRMQVWQPAEPKVHF